MEGRFEHNLFSGIALRLVESRGWFRFAEDVGHAVIADTIARTEVAMGVVIESTPANSPGILWVRCQLIMDAGVAYRVFGKAFHVVNGFGGIGVPHELTICRG